MDINKIIEEYKKFTTLDFSNLGIEFRAATMYKDKPHYTTPGIAIMKDIKDFILTGIKGHEKSVEILYLDNDKSTQLLNVLPNNEDEYAVTYDTYGDIILAKTIPVPDLEIVYKSDRGEKRCRIVLTDLDEIIKLFKYTINNPEHNELTHIAIGYIDFTSSIYGKTLRGKIMLYLLNDMKISCSPMLANIPQRFYNLNDDEDFCYFMTAMYKDSVKMFLLWYATQISLLNPEIAARFHKESVPYDFKQSRKKNRKTPKKYIKRIYFDDLSDIEFGKEKKPHQIKEPFWWVSGHWRNQKTKEGHKRIFIQGYWKGVLRNGPKDNSEPRERELVLDNKTSNFYY